MHNWQDSLAEWSKALAQGASPQGRGFEHHSCHIATHTQTHAHMHTHTRTQTKTQTYKHTRTHACTHTSHNKSKKTSCTDPAAAAPHSENSGAHGVGYHARLACGMPWVQSPVCPCYGMICPRAATQERHHKLNKHRAATCKATPAIPQLGEHLVVDACSNQMVLGSIPAAVYLKRKTTLQKPLAEKQGTPGFEPGTC